MLQGRHITTACYLGNMVGHACVQVQSRSYTRQGVDQIMPMIDLCNHGQHAATVEG